MPRMVKKTVVFNMEDPDQILLHEHANERKNFSGYVKRLIQRDREGGYSVAPVKISSVENRAINVKSFI
ncbi:hypothetical protein [Priestia taiwanensis]|uniref:Uncharacterized protein n=1 Tax=Priestia taiwanensis TaxID=1347902 RepID=A0A917AMJ6_9BACI|nr:hypothetical protein [Priestia taiwanensis]MBM7362421.1 hypothetical protein [Priestia taiwanensis]GGE62101.1 hypothetical protein GCM10007140_10450 [Priestia taiwanensis]